jgi:hypothetical protein
MYTTKVRITFVLRVRYTANLVGAGARSVGGLVVLVVEETPETPYDEANRFFSF